MWLNFLALAFASVITVATFVSAAPPPDSRPRSFLISVGSHDPSHRSPGWSEETCTTLHGQLAELMGAAIGSACISVHTDASGSRKIDEAKGSGSFDYHIRLRESARNNIRLDVENWRSGRDETDFQKAGWELETTEAEFPKERIRKLLRNLALYDRHEREIKETALVSGLSESKELGLSTDGDYFDRSTMRKLSFEQAYSRYKEESPRQKHFLRAVTEIAVVLGAGTYMYYGMTLEANKADWDYHGWKGFRQKLTSFKWRFDNNEKMTNIGHAFAPYYFGGRYNGYSALESLLFTFAASSAWEYLIEAHETISINDQVSTVVGGSVIWEVLYQYGEFFVRGGKNVPNRVLAAIFGSPQRFHAWLDKQKLPKAEKLDEFGFNADVFHRFDISLGFARMENTGPSGSGASDGASFALDTELVNLPGYGREGRQRSLYLDTMSARFMVDGKIDQHGVADLSVLFKSVWAGYHVQDLSKDERERLSGYSFTLGLASAVDYRGLRINDTEKDWIATVNVLGPTLEVVALKNGLKVQFKMDLYADFAMARSLVIESYAEKYGRDGLKSVLNEYEHNNYYFGGGLTANGALTVSYKGFELGAQARTQTVNSFEGLDRKQEQITRDVPNRDRFSSLKAWFSHPVYKDRVRMVYSAEKITRKGSMGDLSRTEHLNRYMGNLLFLF